MLSRDLDPEIGSINKQSKDVVVKIVELIQQMCNYNSSMKFEYVKEVNAHGVTLRHIELWKKIWNGKARPKWMLD